MSALPRRGGGQYVTYDGHILKSLLPAITGVPVLVGQIVLSVLASFVLQELNLNRERTSLHVTDSLTPYRRASSPGFRLAVALRRHRPPRKLTRQALRLAASS